MPTRRKAGSRLISFRLSEPINALLEVEAAKSRESVGECARRLLIAQLQDEERRLVLEGVHELRRQLQTVHDRVGVSLELVLLNLFPGTSRDAHRQFVRENLP